MSSDKRPAPRLTEATEAQSISNKPIVPVPRKAIAAWATVFRALSPEYDQNCAVNIFLLGFYVSVEFSIFPCCRCGVGSKDYRDKRHATSNKGHSDAPLVYKKS